MELGVDMWIVLVAGWRVGRFIFFVGVSFIFFIIGVF